MLVLIFLFGLLATGIVAVGLIFAAAAFEAAEDEYGAASSSDDEPGPGSFA